MWYVKTYIDGCMKCQQYKDYNFKNLTSPETLKMPEKRCGLLFTDFIVGIPKAKDGFESVTKWIDMLSRRVLFVKSKTMDTSLHVIDAFFNKCFKQNGLLNSILSDCESKLRLKFWKMLVEISDV